MMPKRLVIDTNVLVSAALASHSVPARVLLHAFDVASILTSDETLLELVTVLSRKKFDRYVGVERRETFVKKFYNLFSKGFVQDEIELE